jgi:hypothetical protein
MKNQKGKQANKKPKIEKPNVDPEPQKIITLEDMIPRLMKKTGLGEAAVREILTLFPQAIEDLVKSGKTVTIEKPG